MADDETTKAISFPETSGPPFRLSGALRQVQQFYHEVLGAEFPLAPTELSHERFDFKFNHLLEEMNELLVAHRTERDLEKQADALVDIAYVALGALLEMGIHPGAAFDEVHAANMRRKRAETERGAGTFDAVKPEGWVGPNLYQFLSLTRKDIDQLIRHKWVAVHLGAPRPISTPIGRRGPKILVIGHARHGKDTVCEHLRERHGLRFTSSSRFCASRVMMPHYERRGVSYDNVEDCFDDRHNHREEWYQAIAAFNTPDKTALARAILEEHDVYCGLRHHRELHAVHNAGLFDAIVWVDASERVPPEGRDSMTLEPWMAHYIVDNNGKLEDMRASVDAVMERVLYGPKEE